MLKTKDDKFFEYEIIGEFQSDGVWIHPTRRIDSYEMIFVIDGTVFIEEDGAEYELNTNDVLILEPGRLHGGTSESTSPTSFYWFHFRTDMEIPGKTYSGGEYYDLKYLLKKLLHITNSHTYPPETADALGLCAFCEYTNMVEKAAAGNNALLGKIDEALCVLPPERRMQLEATLEKEKRIAASALRSLPTPYMYQTDALADQKFMSLPCPACGKRTAFDTPWFDSGREKYMAISVCPQHGFVFGQMHFKRTPSNTLIMHQRAYPASMEDVEDVRERYRLYQLIPQKKRHHRLNMEDVVNRAVRAKGS